MIILLVALALAAPRAIFADGNWAGFARGSRCEAISRAQRIAGDRREQAYAGWLFDRAGPGGGQFTARLSRSTRSGSNALLTIGEQPFLLVLRDGFAWSRGATQEAAIAAALRTSSAMRIEARSTAGTRFVDFYSLDGAPGAIDAAAACAARR